MFSLILKKEALVWEHLLNSIPISYIYFMLSKYACIYELFQPGTSKHTNVPKNNQGHAPRRSKNNCYVQ